MLSAVFRNTIVQLETPDELRGRVISIHSLVVTAGPRIGDVESALVAAVIGPAATVVVGGLLCLVGVARDGSLAAGPGTTRACHTTTVQGDGTRLRAV